MKTVRDRHPEGVHQDDEMEYRDLSLEILKLVDQQCPGEHGIGVTNMCDRLPEGADSFEKLVHKEWLARLHCRKLGGFY